MVSKLAMVKEPPKDRAYENRTAMFEAELKEALADLKNPVCSIMLAPGARVLVRDLKNEDLSDSPEVKESEPVRERNNEVC